ncbi:MAG: glycosyltransferase family 4 protein [Flavobacteriaceae bacterium]|nr:glycosyltransferase family 4 protein [Flavobacteriaceae bacterium]
MKALIITYYWPPAGGSGVQRWLKFVKYLQNFDVEPVVYTVQNPKYALMDKTLEKEIPKDITILKHPIWEPNDLLSVFKSKQQKTSAGFLNPDPSFLEKKLQYIRANYFIPDARKFWVKPSVKYLTEYLKSNKIDIVITTGPPHSLHLIGMELKNRFPIKWISDFRDPWTDIDYFHQLPLTEKAIQKHKELEKSVLQHSDAVIVIGKTMKEKIDKCNRNIHVISNGFDGDVADSEIELDKKFSITHIGLMNADRNPKTLWKALSEMMSENSEFSRNLEIKLIGEVADEVKNYIADQKLEGNTKYISYVPHQKVMNYQREAQVLLLAVNNVPSAKGIITGKIFEYLHAKRPILAIAPKDGDLAEIITKTNAGFVVDFNDKENLKKIILKLYKKYKVGELKVDSKNIEQYQRKNLTGQLAEVIKEL